MNKIGKTKNRNKKREQEKKEEINDQAFIFNQERRKGRKR